MIRNLLAPSLKAYQLHGVHVLTELHIFPTLPVCNVPAKWSLWLCPILGSKIVLKLLQNEWLKWPSTLECRPTFLKHTTVHIFFWAKLSRYFLPERKKKRVVSELVTEFWLVLLSYWWPETTNQSTFNWLWHCEWKVQGK